ncbi:MAG: exopolyphosphatase [Defluviitaleaceae bacterium]|nr:exopolyphosphatase [Defluviitaleaceae bacterium]MCL2263584.1 exopolyphosphatase [Defluviitaleaceae bacterium]
MRLITRADFDGLVCGSILLELGVIDKWKFVHPRDLQDGKIKVTENDALTNVPYVEGCGLWFDHHASELERVGANVNVEGARYLAPSCARILFNYYEGESRLPHMSEMVDAVDKVDSAQFTVEEIVNPTGWVLFGFIMDPRTGLGHRKRFTKGNWELMEELIQACRDLTITELLMLPDIAERIEYYNQQANDFRNMILEYSESVGNVILTDLREAEKIKTGNRFLLYSIFPEQNISVWVAEGFAGNCVIAVGHSILNRTSEIDVGALMARYGGGGHKQVGTCQVSYEDADTVIREVIEFINGEEITLP